MEEYPKRQGISLALTVFLNSQKMEAIVQKKENTAQNKQNGRNNQLAEMARGKADLSRKDYVMFSVLDALSGPLEMIDL